MELTIGYKNSEVGVIPEDWVVLRLEEIVSFTNGKAHEQFIDKDGSYIVVNSKFIASDGEIYKKASVDLCSLNAGDITMVMSDVPNGKALAKCFLIPESNKYVLNQRICSLRSNSVYIKYLLFILNRNKYYLAFDSGTGQTNLKKSDVLKCPVPIPPTIEEQMAIADAISDVDSLIHSLEKLITKKLAIKQGALQDLIKPKDGWSVKKLGDILKIGHGRGQKEVEDTNGEFPILGSGGVIGKANKYLYNKPSVLIGRKGTIDEPQYMDKPFWTIDTLFYTEIFEPNNAKYIFYQFNLIDWYFYNEASGVPSLNARTIENIEISIPSSDEQTRIAQILTDMDTEIAALEAKLDKYKNIKQGLLQNLLTGRIRLV
ncbi:MAG: restriction endonuclease subunit S [Thermotaleaceae bacterium]